MRGLQDIVDEERKDWGEQLALLKETVSDLQDLKAARAQIAGLKQEISGLKQEIAGLKKTLQQQDQKPRSDDMSDMSKKTYAASNQSAILALICVVMIIANLAIGCWIWHRVNQSSGNLYTLIQQQQKNP